MTDGAAATSEATSRRWPLLLAVVLGLVVLGVVQDTGGRGGALDPNGTGPTGAKALVLLLRQYGATVDVVDGVPSAATSTALVLTDQLDTDRRTAIGDWVTAGGTLVVADPVSDLQVGAATSVDQTHPSGRCAVPGVGDIGRLDVGHSLFLRGEGTGCFGAVVTQGASSGQAWFLLSAPSGRGRVIGLGGAGLWTNERLDHDGNAALAVGLLTPAPGAHVAVLVASRVGSGHRSGIALLGPRAKLALVQLLVAFGALAWWRGRRLGRPVVESQPVVVPASEIVSAVGNLLERTRGRSAAAAQLRSGTRRWLAARMGLAADAPADALADAVVALGGIEHARAQALLDDVPVADDEAFVRLAQSLAQLREEVTHGSVR